MTKSLYLTYSEKDFNEMKKIKDKYFARWETFIYDLVMKCGKENGKNKNTKLK